MGQPKGKGLFGVDWGAVGNLAAGVIMGEPERIATTLAGEADVVAIDAAPQTELHEPQSASCGFDDGTWQCAGHDDAGLCRLVEVKRGA